METERAKESAKAQDDMTGAVVKTFEVPLKRWTLVLLAVGAALLVPWTVVLALTLPASTEVRHWSLAWIGLDALMTAGCATTALLGLRTDPRARLTASATAAVAVLDAWFDITTAPSGGDLAQALACAVAEAGLAAACVALALSEPRKPPVGEGVGTKPSPSP
ncbi:hypothetical protein ACF1AB_36830 [Streptomyces sp. NPDC014846]|uniref:hypothetical protein n=1 Tax=unclassified Streptomyces TaxID=2593676 RepID=UPI0036FC5240